MACRFAACGSGSTISPAITWQQLDKLAAPCVEPKVAMDVLPFMFRRELKEMHLFLAIGEALAHLEYLVHAGRVRRELRDGRVTYISL